MSISPAARAISSVSDTNTAPATQPINASTISRTVSGNGLNNARSETAIRPPGFNTRAISRQTCGLSGERLMTQFEIITSTLASATGKCSISPRRNSTLSKPVFSRYTTALRRAFASISAVISTPMARPVAPTLRPAMKTSNPPPAPRSSTTSSRRNAAIAVGLPQDKPMFAPSGSAASSSLE